MPVIIETKQLSRTFAMGDAIIYALREVDMQIQTGEFVALMGTSGSGKSTLMHLLGCLDTPTSGSYQLEGREVSQLDRDERARLRARRIGLYGQAILRGLRQPDQRHRDRSVAISNAHRDLPGFIARLRNFDGV